MGESYTHIVSISARNGDYFVQVHRRIDDRSDFCSEIELPTVQGDRVDWDSFEKISEWLGKTICIDSPEIRRCLGIEATGSSGSETRMVCETAVAAFELKGFIEIDDVLEPFLLRISSPAPSKGGDDFFCKVHAPSLLRRDVEIFGVDASQAHELAMQFAKSVLGDEKIVDQNRRSIDW